MSSEKNSLLLFENKIVFESADYLASKMNDKQLANIKNVWKNKKASDVTQSVKDMIKKMDIPTQLAIKQADIPHLSKLVEGGDSGDDDSAYAIGRCFTLIERLRRCETVLRRICSFYSI